MDEPSRSETGGADSVARTYQRLAGAARMTAVAASGLAVLVVEDDDTLRNAVGVALRRAGYTVRAEPDGTSVDAAMKQFSPDLAILDVRLPKGPNGYDIARALRRHHDLPILFLTAADNRRARLDGFEAGGDDYVIKPYDTQELLARVAALLRRAERRPRLGDLVLDEAARTATRSGQPLGLTPTEYELLATLVAHAGQVLSKDQLLDLVWPEAFDTNLVEVHMSSLRRKLEIHGPRLIQTLRGTGYTLRP